MAAQQSFRSALNGFNREDVVRYIDYLNAKHASELAQLSSELDYLRAQQAVQIESAAEQPAEATDGDVIEQQAGRIRELFDENKELTQKLADAEALLADANVQQSNADVKLREVRAQLEAAEAQQKSYCSRMEEELTAYRRAERTERLARERAEQLYRQANGALADATVKVDETASQIGELSDRVMTQLTQLQNAVAGSKQALRDAAATMYTIRPTVETEE